MVYDIEDTIMLRKSTVTYRRNIQVFEYAVRIVLSRFGKRMIAVMFIEGLIIKFLPENGDKLSPQNDHIEIFTKMFKHMRIIASCNGDSPRFSDGQSARKPPLQV